MNKFIIPAAKAFRNAVNETRQAYFNLTRAYFFWKQCGCGSGHSPSVNESDAELICESSHIIFLVRPSVQYSDFWDFWNQTEAMGESPKYMDFLKKDVAEAFANKYNLPIEDFNSETDVPKVEYIFETVEELEAYLEEGE